MRKFLPILVAILLSNSVISQSHLKYLDYIFPMIIAGFNADAANITAMNHYYFGIEYKVYMYKAKRDFINTKYGFYNSFSQQTNKTGPATINAAPCVNEDFEASASTTGTTAATAIGTSLVDGLLQGAKHRGEWFLFASRLLPHRW